jgi:hypothetical protein
MKTEYRGYAIDVAVKRKDGLWIAKVWIGPVAETPKALRPIGELAGYTSQRKAEDAGLRWGKERLNLYAQNKLPLPNVHMPSLKSAHSIGSKGVP